MNDKIDDASMELMLELQLQEVQNMSKGKQPQGEDAPDTELATKLFKEELDCLTFQSGH